MENKDFGFKVWYGVGITIMVILLIINIFPVSSEQDMSDMSMEEKRNTFIELKSDIQNENLKHGDYACCLKKPCTYCIEKTPGHGEGAVCSCLDDIMNGVHPCGECIGEILEGHGNPYISNYFATAIAEKTGELEAIQSIIEDKYDIPIEEQI